MNFEEESLYSTNTNPSFGIGQTSYLIQNNEFNLLWDCNAYFDQNTIKTINELGAIDAIALSLPHYYSKEYDWGVSPIVHLIPSFLEYNVKRLVRV